MNTYGVKQFSIQDAKAIIHDICDAAENGNFPTRASFLDMLTLNPLLGAQGYNCFGKIFYWNNASVSLYGHRIEEAINQDLVELILPLEMQKFARDMITKGCRTGQMPAPGAFDLLHKDGSHVTVYSGHLVFNWDHSTTPELYCVDLPILNDDTL